MMGSRVGSILGLVASLVGGCDGVARRRHACVGLRGGSVAPSTKWEAAERSVEVAVERRAELEALNEAEHRAECAKVEAEAWFGVADREACLPAFESFSVGDWGLPDRGDVLRPEVHVTSTALFSREECARVVAMADAHAAKTGGWSSIEAGRYAVHGGWVKDVDGVREWFDEALEKKLYPALASLFPDVAAQTEKLRVQSAYLFKYDAVTGAATDVHVDSGLLSFTIALNGKEAYDGGGTWFEAVDRLVEMDCGEVTFRPGGLRHQGRPVTRGDRYIIGGFIMVEDSVEHGRRSIERGVAALGAANAAANFAAKEGGGTDAALALDALGHAVAVAPRCASAHANLAAARQTFGDLRGACLCFDAVHELNPRDAASYFTHGVALRALGDGARAARCFATAADLDDTDADAAYMVALGAAELGDYATEQAWLEKALRADPRHAKSLVNRGVLHGEAGDLESELAFYERAVDADPDAAVARNALGSCLALRGRLTEGLLHLNHVLDTRGAGDADELQRAEDLVPKVLRMVERQKAALAHEDVRAMNHGDP